MKNYQRILCIGAHSFDAELMGGPIVLKQVKKGAIASMVHLTQGRLENPTATSEEKEIYLESMKKQNDESARRLGASCQRLNYLSNELPSEEEFIKILIDYFMKEKADLIITHAAGTMHRRHYYTHYTVSEAVKQCRLLGMSIDLLYGENCEDLVGFIPQLYLPLNESEVNEWFHSLAAYDLFHGKINDTPYQDYYRTMLKVRSIESSCPQPVKAYMYASLIDNE